MYKKRMRREKGKELLRKQRSESVDVFSGLGVFSSLGEKKKDCISPCPRGSLVPRSTSPQHRPDITWPLLLPRAFFPFDKCLCHVIFLPTTDREVISVHVFFLGYRGKLFSFSHRSVKTTGGIKKKWRKKSNKQRESKIT